MPIRITEVEELCRLADDFVYDIDDKNKSTMTNDDWNHLLNAIIEYKGFMEATIFDPSQTECEGNWIFEPLGHDKHPNDLDGVHMVVGNLYLMETDYITMKQVSEYKVVGLWHPTNKCWFFRYKNKDGTLDTEKYFIILPYMKKGMPIVS